MKELDKRISKLEQVKDPERFNGFAFVIEENQEQMNYPERFRKVPVTGSKFVIFELERLKPGFQ